MGLRDRARVRDQAGVDPAVRAREGRAARPDLPAPLVPPARRRDRPAGAADAGRGAGRGSLGCTPRSRARRQGLRPAQARADQRDPRHVELGTDRVRHRRTRHRQRRDHRPLRHRGAEGEVPAAAAQRRVLLVLLDDRAAGGRRPEDVHHARGQGRRRVGHQRLQVLLVERAHGAVHHRDGGHRPRRERVPGHVDVPGSVRHAGCRRRAPRRSHGRGTRRGHARADPLQRLPRAGRRAARWRRPGLRSRADPPRWWTRPPRHAHRRCVPEGARHDVRAGAVARDAGLDPRRQADGAVRHRRRLRRA